MTLASSKRRLCSTCQYPLRTCICHLCVRLNGRIQVWIVQDKHEAKHAKNTARLMALCYQSTHIIAAHDEVALQNCLRRCDPAHTVLLYPDTKAVSAEQLTGTQRATIENVILLDGTWPKAKKLLFKEPKLARYTKVSFATPPPSQYDIRKSPDAHALSTLEAASYFLECVDDEQFSRIRHAFSDMIALQWSEQPLHHKHHEMSNNNHGKKHAD